MMRLDVLEHGHRWPARVFQRIAALVFRGDMDDVVKTALHRPEFFGAPFLDLVNSVMRGPSFWTAGEREYLATFVSKLNECPFCARVHGQTTELESRGEVRVDAARPVRTELEAVLALVEKLAAPPGGVSPRDIDDVRNAGVPDEAIADAIEVVFVFNTINRLANAFGFSWTSERHVSQGARAIHLFRYKLPGFALR